MTTTTQQGGFSPDYAVAPGETIADLLDEQQITQTELAQRLGVSLKHLNQVISGRVSLSADLGLGLEKVFAVPADFWLTREAHYQAKRAREEQRASFKKSLTWARCFPIKELKERELIPASAEGPELVAALLKFLGIASPEQWWDPSVAYRKSQATESDSYALAAWLRAGELEAREIDCEQFDSDAFRDALDEVRALTREDVSVWVDRLVEICAQAGVAVVVVDAFKKARANGAARWLSPTKALIQLSLRHKWEDIFWFSFFHEAGHLLLHRKKDVFIEYERRAARADDELAVLEEEADRFAGRTLIPPRYDRSLPNLPLGAVPEFAAKIGVSPAIVVGRLQHDRIIGFNQGNRMRGRLEFADDDA